MKTYLIEFRFHGYAKKYLKKTIYEVSRKFRVSGATKKRVVPHVTLFGPFHTNNQKKVISKLLMVSKKYSNLPFQVKGFNNFDRRVIYVDIKPSEELKNFRRDLAKELTSLRSFLIFKTIKTMGVTDYSNDHKFHSTIAFRDIDYKFDKILRYLKNKKTPIINQRLLRVTLLKNGKIVCEYDFILKRLLNRKQALNKNLW